MRYPAHSTKDKLNTNEIIRLSGEDSGEESGSGRHSNKHRNRAQVPRRAGDNTAVYAGECESEIRVEDLPELCFVRSGCGKWEGSTKNREKVRRIAGIMVHHGRGSQKLRQLAISPTCQPSKP